MSLSVRRIQSAIAWIAAPEPQYLSAKADDIPLHSDDIIYVPPSRGKMQLGRGANSALSMITSLAIYRF